MTADELKWIRIARQACASGVARSLREVAGLSLREVASVVGVSAAAIHRWETGQRRPRGASAAKFGRTIASLNEAGPDA